MIILQHSLNAADCVQQFLLLSDRNSVIEPDRYAGGIDTQTDSVSATIVVLGHALLVGQH